MNSKRLLEQLYIASKIGITSKENGKVLKDYYKVVLQDLERLEKIEKWVNDKLDYLNNDIFLVADDYLKGAIRILLELKEVLGNE